MVFVVKLPEITLKLNYLCCVPYPTGAKLFFFVFFFFLFFFVFFLAQLHKVHRAIVVTLVVCVPVSLRVCVTLAV